MSIIEIQTIEGGRLEWVGIYSGSNDGHTIRWGDDLISRVNPKPNIRILDRQHGKVIGAWQAEGYEEESA
jgi:hypothetical protein